MARAAVVAVAVAALAAALAPVASASWAKPVRLAGPESEDVLPAQLAFSPLGDTAIAFGVQNPDTPQGAQAFTALRTAAGTVARPRRVPRALAVLGLAYESSTLELLTGSSTSGLACCDTVKVAPWSGSRLGKPQTLVRGLTGRADGDLVPLAAAGKGKPGGMLAAIATQRGVWTAQQDAGGKFAATRRLRFKGSPTDMAAAALPNGGGVVAWAVAIGGFNAEPQRILVATGTPKSGPSRALLAVTVPAGHSIDQVAVAAGSKAPTLAWVESWYDSVGAFHSAIEVLDLNSTQVHTLSPRFELASDLSFLADPAGDQVVAYDGCSSSGACVARAAVRRRGRAFGKALWLGSVDPSQQVATAISGKGEALVGWISGGHVIAAAHQLRAGRFARARVVSRTNDAADLTLAFGPADAAMAAWTQATATPEVFGAKFSG